MGARVTNERVDAALASLDGVRVGDVFLKPVGKRSVMASYVLVRWACGHEVEVQWNHLQSGRTKGCSVRLCPQSKQRAASSAALSARNEQVRLASFAEAKATAEAEGCTNFTLIDLRPDKNASVPGGVKMAPWVSYACPSGHEHEMRLYDWRRGVRCPDCADHGYQPSKPGTLYLCHRDVHGGIQRMYGITNNPARRLAEHAKRGWVLIDRFDGDGRRVADFESAIKRYMKDTGLHGSIYAGDDGETEAWAYDDLPIDSVRQPMLTVANHECARV